MKCITCFVMSVFCLSNEGHVNTMHQEFKMVLFFVEDYEIKDGERIPLAIKDMGSCEIFPQTLSHNPNGRYCNFKTDICQGSF